MCIWAVWLHLVFSWEAPSPLPCDWGVISLIHLPQSQGCHSSWPSWSRFPTKSWPDKKTNFITFQRKITDKPASFLCPFLLAKFEIRKVAKGHFRQGSKVQWNRETRRVWPETIPALYLDLMLVGTRNLRQYKPCISLGFGVVGFRV